MVLDEDAAVEVVGADEAPANLAVDSVIGMTWGCEVGWRSVSRMSHDWLNVSVVVG